MFSATPTPTMRRHHRTRHNSNTPDQEAARIFEAKLKLHVRDNPECQWEYDWYRNTLKKSIRRSRVQIDQQVAKKAESGQPLCDKFMRELEKPHSYLDELSSPTLGGLLSPMSPLSPRSSYFDGAVTSDSSPEREASRAQSPARDSSVSPERSQSVHLALGGVSDPTTTVPGGFVPVVAPSAQSPETSPRVNPRTVIPNTPYNESAVSSVAPTPVLPGAFFPSSSIENSPAMRPDVIPTVPTSGVPSSLGESNSTKPTIQQDVPEIAYVPEPDLDITTPRFEQPSPFDNLGLVQFPHADDSSRVEFPRDDAVREAVDDSTRAREIDIPIDDSSRKVDDSTGKIPRTNPVLTPHTSSQPGDHPNVLDSALGVSSLVSSNAEDHRPIVGDEPVERAPPVVEQESDSPSGERGLDSPPEDVPVSQPPRGPYKLPGTFQSSVQSLDPSASIDDLSIQVPSSEHVQQPDTARTPTEKQPGEHSSIPAAPSRGPYRLPGSFQESVQSLELGSTDDVTIQVPTELVEASVVDDAKTPTKERKHFIFSPLDEDTTVQLPKDTPHTEPEPEPVDQDSKSTQDLDDSLVYDSEPGPELDQFPHPPPLHVPTTTIDPDSQKSPTSPVIPGAYQRKFFSFTPLLPTQSLEGSSPNPNPEALPPVPAPPPPPAGLELSTGRDASATEGALKLGTKDDSSKPEPESEAPAQPPFRPLVGFEEFDIRSRSWAAQAEDEDDVENDAEVVSGDADAAPGPVEVPEPVEPASGPVEAVPELVGAAPEITEAAPEIIQPTPEPTAPTSEPVEAAPEPQLESKDEAASHQLDATPEYGEDKPPTADPTLGAGEPVREVVAPPSQPSDGPELAAAEKTQAPVEGVKSDDRPPESVSAPVVPEPATVPPSVVTEPAAVLPSVSEPDGVPEDTREEESAQSSAEVPVTLVDSAPAIEPWLKVEEVKHDELDSATAQAQPELSVQEPATGSVVPQPQPAEEPQREIEAPPQVELEDTSSQEPEVRPEEASLPQAESRDEPAVPASDPKPAVEEPVKTRPEDQGPEIKQILAASHSEQRALKSEDQPAPAPQTKPEPIRESEQVPSNPTTERLPSDEPEATPAAPRVENAVHGPEEQPATVPQVEQEPVEEQDQEPSKPKTEPLSGAGPEQSIPEPSETPASNISAPPVPAAAVVINPGSETPQTLPALDVAKPEPHPFAAPVQPSQTTDGLPAPNPEPPVESSRPVVDEPKPVSAEQSGSLPAISDSAPLPEPKPDVKLAAPEPTESAKSEAAIEAPVSPKEEPVVDEAQPKDEPVVPRSGPVLTTQPAESQPDVHHDSEVAQTPSVQPTEVIVQPEQKPEVTSQSKFESLPKTEPERSASNLGQPLVADDRSPPPATGSVAAPLPSIPQTVSSVGVSAKPTMQPTIPQAAQSIPEPHESPVPVVEPPRPVGDEAKPVAEVQDEALPIDPDSAVPQSELGPNTKLAAPAEQPAKSEVTIDTPSESVVPEVEPTTNNGPEATPGVQSITEPPRIHAPKDAEFLPKDILQVKAEQAEPEPALATQPTVPSISEPAADPHVVVPEEADEKKLAETKVEDSPGESAPEPAPVAPEPLQISAKPQITATVQPAKTPQTISTSAAQEMPVQQMETQPHFNAPSKPVEVLGETQPKSEPVPIVEHAAPSQTIEPQLPTTGLSQPAAPTHEPPSQASPSAPESNLPHEVTPKVDSMPHAPKAAPVQDSVIVPPASANAGAAQATIEQPEPVKNLEEFIPEINVKPSPDVRVEQPTLEPKPIPAHGAALSQAPTLGLNLGAVPAPQPALAAPVVPAPLDLASEPPVAASQETESARKPTSPKVEAQQDLPTSVASKSHEAVVTEDEVPTAKPSPEPVKPEVKVEIPDERTPPAVDLDVDGHGTIMSATTEAKGPLTPLDEPAPEPRIQSGSPTPPDEPEPPADSTALEADRLSKEGDKLAQQFGAYGNVDDLDDAIEAYGKAAELLAPNPETLDVSSYLNLGRMMRIKFEAFSNIEDLDSALDDALLKALDSLAPSPTHKSYYDILHELGAASLDRYLYDGSEKAGNDARQYCRQALAIPEDAPNAPSGPKRAATHVILSRLHLTRFEYFSTAEDAINAIKSLDDASRADPTLSNDARYMENRARALYACYQTRQPDYSRSLDEAFELAQAARDLTPSETIQFPIASTFLAELLLARYERSGEQSDRDLTEALDLLEGAVQDVPFICPEQPWVGERLARALVAKFTGDNERDREDLDDAISFLEIAVNLTVTNPYRRQARLDRFGGALTLRFRHFALGEELDANRTAETRDLMTGAGSM